ncbi:hypothetical protein PanWU01x14_041180 [Parasponia andersonii]|uniref:Uncharacterized protein n=1 Tax=Parasponia andersonii TaxID=3476 RepID=A0A2P5DQC5_PARAD|nr:hypothetical protein PanWU01x14_041180 [Parasponia andersonii]
MTTKTQSNNRIKKSTQAQNIPKIVTFDSGITGLRYIYLELPLDKTNLTSPVIGQIVVRIVAGGEKSETVHFVFSGNGDLSGGGSWSMSTRRGTRELRQWAVRADDDGRWHDLLLPFRPTERQRERVCGRREPT